MPRTNAERQAAWRARQKAAGKKADWRSQRIAALEARVAELEARVRELEAAAGPKYVSLVVTPEPRKGPEWVAISVQSDPRNR